jgi:hypothetical protein
MKIDLVKKVSNVLTENSEGKDVICDLYANEGSNIELWIDCGLLPDAPEKIQIDISY